MAAKLKTIIFLTGRRVVYGLLRLFDRISGRFNPVVILCYHAIGYDEWRYSTNPEDFRVQLTILKNEGYQFVTLSDVEAFLDGKKRLPSKVAIINFDDGYQDILSVRDVIREFGIKPTLFVLSDRAGSSRTELSCERRFLSREEIISLSQDGWIIGCHSATHESVVMLDAEGLHREIVQSREMLERELSLPIRYFAYPKGAYTRGALAAIQQAGYALALSMDDGIVTRDSDRFTLPRVGVDRTHNAWDFPTLYTPSVLVVRGLIKRWLGWSGEQLSRKTNP